MKMKFVESVLISLLHRQTHRIASTRRRRHEECCRCSRERKKKDSSTATAVYTQCRMSNKTQVQTHACIG